MADFSAKDVQTLRRRTGAGMMDAKRALEETGGDMEAAARWLREKGLAQSAKRSDRAAEQGAVSVANTGSVAAAVQAQEREARLAAQRRRHSGDEGGDGAAEPAPAPAPEPAPEAAPAPAPEAAPAAEATPEGSA